MIRFLIIKFGLTQDDVELHMTLFAFQRVLHDDWLNQVATNASFLNSTNSRHWTMSWTIYWNDIARLESGRFKLSPVPCQYQCRSLELTPVITFRLPHPHTHTHTHADTQCNVFNCSETISEFDRLEIDRKKM